eukprot:TRINITY_DN8469_c0_g1_i2.p1 TRINITY_DN8469_c0_g1~~TRINITY_DN8469_c0_g1_i2.p1  ORF type:complete len:262 (+),score=60.80 TRINITY_DN8469_c0_g1_i2:59-844(+)
MTTEDDLEIFSEVIGWVYFLAWSVSFYPQIILNYQRKSVVGLSFDYQIYNTIGFSSYTIYNLFYFYGEKKDSIKSNDVFFAIHAIILTLVTVFQCTIYEKKDQKVSKTCYAICSGFVLTWIISIILGLSGTLEWTDSIDIFGYVKSGVSFVKYLPQAYLNYQRKSTVGWSIHNILLDITGGVLSFLQLFIDAEIENDYSELTDNIPKLLLSIETVFFDVIFIVQHYVLYGEKYQVLVDPGDYSGKESNKPVDSRLAFAVDA